uniref:Uncharacterized protein n=1 Tax=Avena sativa TaxID=4498 RepID=A0ACD5W495_AVESA
MARKFAQLSARSSFGLHSGQFQTVPVRRRPRRQRRGGYPDGDGECWPGMALPAVRTAGPLKKKTCRKGKATDAALAMAEDRAKTWMSKNRLSAKRLLTLAKGLNPEKRAVIASKSAFKSYLDVSPFRIPSGLIDYIALHTNPNLREYKTRKNIMVFTRDMVRKVFGIRCGNKPIELLNKNDPCELQDIYKAGSTRAKIATVVALLESCANTDEATIIRTWDLLCLALVVAPKSSNNISTEYLASMVDPTKTNEYAWDEHLLDLAMAQVDHIRKQKAMPLKLTDGESKYEFWITGPFAFLGISYMDHLSFPQNCGHVFNKSLPRVCFVTNNDFDFVVEHDLELNILNNTTVFVSPLSETPYNTDLGNEQVNEAPPAHTLAESEVNLSASLNEWLVFPSSQELEVPSLKHLAEKHTAFWASDVETTMKNLAVGLKRMHSQRMAALLVDIDAQLKDGAGPSVVFPADAGLDNEEERENVFKEQEPFDGLNKSDDVEASVYAAKEDVAEARRDEAKEDDTEAIEDEAKENEAAAIRGEKKQESELQTHVHILDMPQSAVVLDSSPMGGIDVPEQQPVDSPVTSPRRRDPSPCPAHIDPEAWNRAPEAPGLELFSQDSDDVEGDADKVAAGIPAVEVPDSAPSVAAETPSVVDRTEPCVVPIDSSAKGDGSSGMVTHEKKTRFKRAAKEELTPPKSKKIKVSKDQDEIYTRFVSNGRTFKRLTKKRKEEGQGQRCFVQIGRYFCTYKGFKESLKPHAFLSTEVMNVWIEKFNHEAMIICKNSACQKRRYAFTHNIVEKLVFDPKTFNAATCLDEFNDQCAKYKILKCDILYFPTVRNEHWAVPTVNIMMKQYHIFDSMKLDKGAGLLDELARNLFLNFTTLVDPSKLDPKLAKDMELYLLKTPDHPQQVTLFDCGFFGILFMENFNGKVMAEFDNNYCPDLRRTLAADLIEARENQDSVEKLMEEEFNPK